MLFVKENSCPSAFGVYTHVKEGRIMFFGCFWHPATLMFLDRHILIDVHPDSTGVDRRREHVRLASGARLQDVEKPPSLNPHVFREWPL